MWRQNLVCLINTLLKKDVLYASRKRANVWRNRPERSVLNWPKLWAPKCCSSCLVALRPWLLAQLQTSPENQEKAQHLLDLMILRVFPNLNNSMIPPFCCAVPGSTAPHLFVLSLTASGDRSHSPTADTGPPPNSPAPAHLHSHTPAVLWCLPVLMATFQKVPGLPRPAATTSGRYSSHRGTLGGVWNEAVHYQRICGGTPGEPSPSHVCKVCSVVLCGNVWSVMSVFCCLHIAFATCKGSRFPWLEATLASASVALKPIVLLMTISIRVMQLKNRYLLLLHCIEVQCIRFEYTLSLPCEE